MSQKLIVAVDDEPDLLELIRFNLEREGYRFVGAETGEAGLALVNGLVASPGQDGKPALIILDLMLPGIDGLSLCRKLKAAPDTRNIPVIMLTAKGEETDVVTGLEVGADDYISKPFSPRVLIARVRSLLRARDEMKEQLADALQKNPSGSVGLSVGPGPIAGFGVGGVGPGAASGTRSGADRGSTPGSQNIIVGQIQIDLPRHEVRCAGSPVDLSATEFAILEFLARNPGWVFSRNRIIDGVKGKDYPVTERSVDVQILGLRKKLGSLGDYIQTVRGVGYRLQVP